MRTCASLRPAGSITTDGITLTGTSGTSVVITQTSTGVTINSTGSPYVKYDLTGQLSGTLSVSSSSAYQLYLNGVTINGTAGPALDLESTQKVFIVSASGTTNTLADSSTRTLTMKAALYGKGPMVFSGDGTISVTGGYKHGVFSNDYIRMRGGTLNVTVSAKDAVRSVNGFIFDDGRLTVVGTGTTSDDESKGIDRWVGREIESCCELAHLMTCSLCEAASYIVPVATSDASRMDTLRQASSRVYNSASYLGLFDAKRGAATGRAAIGGD